eukprot:6175491-Pleurochrysis_carterae.AAC.3
MAAQRLSFAFSSLPIGATTWHSTKEADALNPEPRHLGKLSFLKGVHSANPRSLTADSTHARGRAGAPRARPPARGANGGRLLERRPLRGARRPKADQYPLPPRAPTPATR